MIKPLLTSLFLFAAASLSNAQTLQIDPETKLFTYTAVVPADSLSQDIIFSRVSKWIATSFKDAKSVIEHSDRGAGEIVGNGNFTYDNGFGSYPISFTMNISIKDNRFRFEATRFIAGNPANQYPLENKMIARQKKLMSTTEQEMKELVASLQKEVKTPSSSKKDW